jgi:hypothetical protein
MTATYITIDTEYSPGLFQKLGRNALQENFDRSIRCSTPDGDVGIEYQMDIFDRHGLKAVFFVDPFPALIWGVSSVANVVRPIIDRGHDVQLHIHTEWLALAGAANPLGSTIGQNIKDFSLTDQKVLVNLGISWLMDAGAPRPVAFRAGNYGANDDTLRALAELGIAYDTSLCPGIAPSDCDISLNRQTHQACSHHGIIEVPIGSICSKGGTQRHAQLTALSSEEMLAALWHAGLSNWPQFTIVSHSFELLSRDRTRINQVVKRRFERICRGLERQENIRTATYADDPPAVSEGKGKTTLLPHSTLRSCMRMAEQLVSNTLYGAT